MDYRYLFYNLPYILLFGLGITTSIQGQDTSLVDFKLFHSNIDFISDDGNGNICLSTWVGVYNFDGEKINWLRPNREHAVFIYKNGSKMILYKRAQKDIDPAGDNATKIWKKHLISGSAQTLSQAKDKNGRIWIANGERLYCFEITRQFNRSFTGKSIRGILPINNGLLVATYSGMYFNQSQILFDSLYAQGHLFEWEDDILISYGGVLSYNLQNDTFVEYHSQIGSSYFNILNFDTLNHRLYIATTVGLMTLKGDSLLPIAFSNRLEDLSVHQDKIFLAAYDGIYSSDGTNSHKVSAFPSLHFNSIQYIDGIWWATSREGIWKWKPGQAKAEQLFPGQELAQLETYCLAKDPFGYIWASCISGLVRFKPDEGIYEHYLRSIEFNKRSVAQHGDTIYFGSLNGLFSFHPSQFGEIKATKKPTQPIPRWIFVLIAGIVLVFGLFAYTQFRKWQRVSHLLEIKLTEPNDTADSFLQELEKYIHSHIQYVTVESLIDFTGLSRRGLYQVLETRYQLKPGDLIRQIKQQRIQEILQQQPDISMEELAGLVGYSAAHVIRILKGE